MSWLDLPNFDSYQARPRLRSFYFSFESEEIKSTRELHNFTFSLAARGAEERGRRGLSNPQLFVKDKR